MKPIRATYGAYDNSHKLLTCDDDSISLPIEIEGLTDRPPGDITPGEIWWPSVGCGPFENWWCLWWTLPDSTTQRAGMVVSEVALWPLSEIGEVEDLVPTFRGLSGDDSFTPASDTMLTPVAEALLKQASQLIILSENLIDWPRIIAGLWGHLSQGFMPGVFTIPGH